MMMFFAATYPQRTSALVLFGTWARYAQAPDYPWGISPEIQEERLAQAEQGRAPAPTSLAQTAIQLTGPRWS